MTRSRIALPLFAAALSLGATEARAQTAAPPPNLRPDTVGRQVAALPPPPANPDETVDFRDLIHSDGMTADRAAAMAIESSPSMARARASLRGTEAIEAQVRVNLYPRLQGSARATYTQPNLNGGLTQGMSQMQIDNIIGSITAINPDLGQFFSAFFNSTFPYYRSQYSFDVNLTYPVSAIFFQVLPQYRAAGHVSEATRLQLATEQQTVEMQARTLYYTYVRAVGAERIAEITVEATRAQLERMQALREAGVASDADLYRIEAVASAADVGVVRARTQRETSLRMLQVFLAGEEGPFPTITVGEDVMQEVPDAGGSLDQLEQRAIDRRSELAGLRSLYSAQLERIKAAQGGRYPVFSVAANVMYANPNTRIFPQTREFRTTWDLNAVLTWSPNDLMANRALMHREQAERDRLEAEHAALVDGVRVEVAQAYNGFVASREAITAARAELRASNETYRARFEQLQQGTVVTTEVVDAFRALTNARLQLLDASIAMRLARAGLARAVGDYAPEMED
ncbi:MAG: TolC family protein [Polyangiales bacterium]